MEAIGEAMRDIAFEFWNQVLLMYRTMVIKAELKRRKAIAYSQDRSNNKCRKANLLLGQNQTECAKERHCIIIEDDVSSTAGTPCRIYNCDRSEMKRVFDRFDADKDGRISADELQKYMKRLGFELSDQTVKDMLRSVATNSDNYVDFEEFLSLYSSLCGGGEDLETGDSCNCKLCDCSNCVREDGDEEGNLLKAFFLFDENKDGLISVLELQQVLLKLGLPEGRSLLSCRKMIENVDADGNGKVDFFEFKDLMCSNEFSCWKT